MMTPQEINEAIAKELGWEYHEPTSETGDICIWFDPNGLGYYELPNYHGSLDACAEFESVLRYTDEQIKYTKLLHEECNQDTHLLVDFQCITMPSIKRCEAFLRLKGKWKD